MDKGNNSVTSNTNYRNSFAAFLLVVMFAISLFLAVFMTTDTIIFEMFALKGVYISAMMWLAVVVSVVGLKSVGMDFNKRY